jgi:hypothetical protein
MEQVGTQPAAANPARPAASWAAWDAYYREASRRRRARGTSRNTLREEKRRRRIRERLGIGVSALFVAALTAVFYFVLSQ